MKTHLLALSLVLALASCGENKTAESTEATDTTAMATEAPEEKAPPLDSAAKMKAWMDYMMPGDMHKWLASTDGSWTVETESWMEEGQPSVKSTGSMENKMILGGRYQQQMYKGEMMGQPFEVIGLLGYDNSKKMFVSTWLDNMGTGIMVMEGKMDDATKTINFSGSMTDATTGKDCKMREVVQFPDEKTQHFEMYATTDGKEMKVMEMKLTKK